MTWNDVFSLRTRIVGIRLASQTLQFGVGEDSSHQLMDADCPCNGDANLSHESEGTITRVSFNPAFAQNKNQGELKGTN